MTGAGQQQVPVEHLLGEEARRGTARRSRLGRLLAWRDWKLPVKLAAVTLVPLVIAVVLGASTLSGQIASSQDYGRIDSMVTLTGQTGGLLNAVQRERAETVAMLTGTGGSNTALRQAREDVDAAIAPMTRSAKLATDQDAGIAAMVARSKTALKGLSGLRDDISAGTLGPIKAINAYSEITDALLQLEAASVARVSDDAMGGTPRAVVELDAAHEQMSRQQAVIGVGAVRGTLTPSQLMLVRTEQVRIDDHLTSFAAVATPSERELFDNTLSEPSSQQRDRTVRAVLGELGKPSAAAVAGLSPRTWSDVSGQVTDQLGQVADQLTAKAVATSNSLASDAKTGVIGLAVALGLALLVGLLVVVAITRQLLHSLRVLRTSAMAVADERLPAAVRRIQDGTGAGTSIEPVPVTATDEVGEVARAFDAVHQQALRLAAEQASMRTAYSGVFVNLSRRSQSLVQRQLQLIERLERDEEDADQLATLFQLDHLATRMRRNNENLMMLSGAETGRRSGRPVSTADVLRAAVSEIEQYQRVIVQSPPTTKVVGHAASDLMRLLAELLDNAAAFSPPETQVTVTTKVTDNGAMTIDVVDRGIGMNVSEVAEANARMGEASGMTMVTSRRMGLFVVGRLASKHGFGVTLHGGKENDGIRATIAVPAELVIGAGGGPLTSEIPVVTESAPAPREPKSSPRTPANGAAAPESDVEISGTALFAPVGDDNGTPQRGARKPAGAAAGLPQRTPGSANGTSNGTTTGAKNGKQANGSDLPSGSALFKAGTSPLSDWWQAAASEPPPPKEAASSRPEKTPIFDEMLSVWFRTSGDPAETEQAESGDAARGKWTFEADENWRTVAEIAQKSPADSFTEAGLPKRQRGERLLPGSAAGEQASDKPSRSLLGRVDLPERDPSEVKGRLSSFQRGLSRGKHHLGKHNAETPDAGAEKSSGTSAKHDSAAKQTSSGSSKQSSNGQQQKPSNGQPKSTANGSGKSGSKSSGGAASKGGAKSPAKGQQNGKRTPAKKSEPAAKQNDTRQDKPDAGRNGAQRTPEQPQQPDLVPDPMATDDEPVTDIWDFSRDAELSKVDSVTSEPPPDYTTSGLPRRRRGAQLLPGSATTTTKTAPAKPPQPDRDPNAMRGRLSSFQQGVRRGRDSTNQPESTSQENGG